MCWRRIRTRQRTNEHFCRHRRLAGQERSVGNGSDLFTHVRQQRHEPSALESGGDSALEGRTIARPFAAIELALAGGQLLETLDILVIDKRRPRTAFLRAIPTTTLATYA